MKAPEMIKALCLCSCGKSANTKIEKTKYWNIGTICISFIHLKCNMSDTHVPDTIAETVNYA